MRLSLSAGWGSLLAAQACQCHWQSRWRAARAGPGQWHSGSLSGRMRLGRDPARRRPAVTVRRPRARPDASGPYQAPLHRDWQTRGALLGVDSIESESALQSETPGSDFHSVHKSNSLMTRAHPRYPGS
jgi:hypothetical protein